MDYIFKDWEEKLKAFEGSVEKDLEEVRKCKAEIQQMKVEVVNQLDLIEQQLRMADISVFKYVAGERWKKTSIND